MSMIQVLDESTINQIAAGEVVERPSAVVKELIENAMDAGATAITAEIKEGGLSLIRITDNGSGIEKGDIPLAFLRHATSKIRTAEDLLTVSSLGFRGEALSSIAAVAQVELITKTPDALLGYRYVIEGGEEKSFEEIGSPSGTTFIIRNLFYNTPARRKFLKSPSTETGYVSDLIERLMVSHPNVSFKFIVNNQVKLQSSGNNNTKDILYNVYGREIAKELIPIEYRSESLSIFGYIGKPIINRGNRNYENYFINGRYIKSSVILRAIEEAYKPFLMQHKYPFTSLYFQIDPSDIDVNVHPQKLEVRLKTGDEIYSSTFQTIREALTQSQLIPSIALQKEEVKKEKPKGLPEPFEKQRLQQLEALKIMAAKRQEGHLPGSSESRNIESKVTGSKNMDPLNTDSVNHESAILSSQPHMVQEDNGYSAEAMIPPNPINPFEQDVVSGEQITLFEQTEENHAPFLSGQGMKTHRIIGQVFQTYWMIEYHKELYIIDQHAAHEKVLYERIMAAAKTKSYNSQQLLPPMVLTLTLKEQNVLKQYEETLQSIGYEFEHFGGNEYSVRAVPASLYGLSEKSLLLEFLDSLTQEYNEDIIDMNSVLDKVASLSCKAAVKANHEFSQMEAESLIKELLTLENPYHCPHGRPVIVSMSRYELEKKFKRIL